MVDGVTKHGADPGFPSFFAVNNLTAEHDMVAQAILAENAARARERSLLLGWPQRSADAQTAYARAVAAVEGWLGLDNPQLREFGVRPRKGKDSKSAAGARKARKTRRLKKAVQAQTSSPSGQYQQTPGASTGTKGGAQ
jgi:hypothetical protein